MIKTAAMQRVEEARGQQIDSLLRDLYITKGMTLAEIGNDLGITAPAVYRWLRRCGIRRIPPDETASNDQ